MDYSTHEYVELYRSLGWAPVRVPPLSKAPLEKQWPTLEYLPSSFVHGDNIGIKLGQPSNGLIDVDLDCPEAVHLAPLFLPTTASFGRNGAGKTAGTAIPWDRVGQARHYLYTCTTTTKKLPRTHIEIRSTGLQTVFPGSLHESGEPIRWIVAARPLDIVEADLHAAVGRLSFATVLARAWATLQGVRHQAILAVAGALWHAGWTLEEAGAVLLSAVGIDGSSDQHREQAIRSTFDEDDKPRTGWPTVLEVFGPIDGKALQRCAELVPTVPRWRRSENASGEAGDLHDVGNAERFLREFGEDLRYTPGLGWLQWDGSKWAENEPTHLVIQSVRALAKAGEDQSNVALVKWSHSSLSAGRISAAKNLAAELSPRFKADQLDANPWILNCPNGVVDLRTGQLTPHDRHHLNTRCTGVEYDPSATAPRFLQFLNEIFVLDFELVAYVMRYLGYAITGDVREQMFQVWHGFGANGKSTLIELLLYVLGDYAQRMADDLLTARKFGRDSSSPSPDVARMRGSRFTAGTEAEEGTRWNEPLVKSLTGADRVVARHLRQEPIEFSPTWKIVLAVNHRPIVRGTDHGIWRRIHLVPFEAKFTGAKIDATLSNTLALEGPGVLALLVRACLDWQRYGLAPPSKVIAAGQNYRDDHDVIGSFLRECTKRDARGSVTKMQLYRTFKLWARDSGAYEMSKHAFTRMIADRGVLESNNSESWIEIALATSTF